MAARNASLGLGLKALSSTGTVEIPTASADAVARVGRTKPKGRKADRRAAAAQEGEGRGEVRKTRKRVKRGGRRDEIDSAVDSFIDGEERKARKGI